MTVAPALIGVAVDEEVLFSDHKGQRRPRIEKRQRKRLAGIQPLLRVALEPGEKVLQVVEAISPYSVMEFLTTGWLSVLIKRCLLVFTDRGILHLPARSYYAPKRSISRVRYDDLADAKVTSALGHRLKLRYAHGGKEDFTGLRWAAAKKVRALIAGRTGHGQPTLAAGRVFLCPRCGKPLEPGAARCGGCDLAFKTKERALRTSLLFPGGGYFYTEHPWLGIGDAIVETVLIVGVVFGAAALLTGDQDALPVLIICGVLLALEKLITVYHARHYVAEAIPADRHFKIG